MMVLKSVLLVNDTTVFGKHGKQVSATMEDLSIAWDEERGMVIVTSPSRPGVEEWILPALIGKLCFADDGAKTKVVPSAKR